MHYEKEDFHNEPGEKYDLVESYMERSLYIVTYMISKKMEVQTACLDREVSSPKTARKKAVSGICR